MPRITPVEPETATGRAAVLLTSVKKALGAVPNMTTAMAVSPAVLEGWLGLNSALGRGRLPAGLRERIALAVAEANGCDYCLAAHSYLGTNVAGLSAADVDAARRQEADDPRTAAALRFAGRLVETQGGVTDADVEAVRAHGFDDAEIAELIAAVALNVLTNYFNKAVDTDIDFPAIDPPAAA